MTITIFTRTGQRITSNSIDILDVLQDVPRLLIITNK